MPTLQKRSDGCFYIHHFFRQTNTWQVLGEGVRYLARRGVTEGQHFRTDLFMELWSHGLVYHGDVAPATTPAETRDSAAADSLRTRVQEFHGLLYSGNSVSAWAILTQVGTNSVPKDQFAKDISAAQSVPWKITDVLVYDVPVDRRAEFEGAARLGVAHVELNETGRTAGSRRDLKEYWFELNKRWGITWFGLGEA